VPTPRIDRRHRYAVTGVALLAPVAAMYWLDVLRGRRPSAGFAAVGAAGLACAALASPQHPARVSALAAGGVALAGLALDRYVSWLERLEERP
jgi:hypothetical protein